MSSKADDFDVRYRDAGGTGQGRPGASGGYGGNVDYDLGYDANGWDTNGFRSPDADYVDSRDSRPHEAGMAGSYDTATGTHASMAAGTQEIRPLRQEPGRSGPWTPAGPRRAGRVGGPGGPGGPAGPGGPGGPGGPRGLRGPGRRGLDRGAVKVKGSWWRHWTLRKALGVVLAGIGAFVVLGAITVAVAYEETPVPSEALAATGFTQTEVLSGNGTLIGRFGTTNRQMLSYSQLEQNNHLLVDAVLAAEDRNYFNEGGISPSGIMRAAYEDFQGGDGSLQGGSTITQEFVRQYYSGIGTQQTLSRKIKEIFVSMKVAKDKSKPWILTNYLNTIYLGQGSYGVEAAAKTYYGKTVEKLDAAQAAVIAAIIQQPSTYPLPQYRPQLEARWHYVLNGMVKMGSLTQQQADTMKFPIPGDNVPQTVGADVWDPYVLAMVYNELTEVDHLTQSQIYGGGYTIRTTIDDTKMKALYQAVIENEAQINDSADPLKYFMHAGAVLEDPGTGAIEALYPGPGYIGQKYNGIGKVITKKECAKIYCQVNMAVYNREQVGSSFKPYVLAAAVKAGMDVQTSTLNGYNNLWIPPDTLPDSFATLTQPVPANGSHQITNDDTSENGPFTPQMAMAESINTAYTDLWHRVGGAAIVNIASMFGVNVNDHATGFLTYTLKGQQHLGIEDTTGLALGEASMTVGEQATMLAAIDNGGTYHAMHVVKSIAQASALPVPTTVKSYPVFSNNPTLNADEASQVQYAMSKDTEPYGTAPTAGMSNGQEIIAKTGTTDTAQSAFFVGAIPTQSLAVALFTNHQGTSTKEATTNEQTLNNLGGNSQGGFGGTWPATIWHTYAENMFVSLGVEPFTAPIFTGTTWNQVPPNLRKVAKKKSPKKQGNQGGQPGQQGSGNGNPNPFPTYSCDPSVVTCTTADISGTGTTGTGTTQSVSATQAGAAAGGIFAALPATCLWVRRRMRKRGPRRG